MLKVQPVGWSGSGIAVIVTIFLWFFGIGAAVGWSEELAFRGYLLQNLGEGIGLRWAEIHSCLLYGAGHMSNSNSTWLSGMLIAAIGFLRIFGRKKKTLLSENLQIKPVINPGKGDQHKQH